MSRRRSIFFLGAVLFKVLAHAVVALPWKRRQKLERTWYTLNLAGTVAITPAGDSAVGGISYFKDTHHPSSGKKGISKPNHDVEHLPLGKEVRQQG